jgi:putative polyhydroxyalkanoate system protein
MNGVRIHEPHALGTRRAVQVIQGLEHHLAKYLVSLDWTGDQARIRSAAVSGDVQVDEKTIRIRVDLGILARLARVDPVRLEAAILRRLRAGLAKAGRAQP